MLFQFMTSQRRRRPTTRLRRRFERRRFNRRGAAAVLAMLFLTIFATLTVGMMSMSTLNMQGAANLSAVDRARAAAESGLRWQAYRFQRMSLPSDSRGTISHAVAEELWPGIKSSIRSDYLALSNPLERVAPTDSGLRVVCPPIALSTDRTETFQISIERDADDARYIHVTSTGTFGSAVRRATMTFKVDKKVRYAVVGKVPIQLGRNTVVEGPVAMATPNKYPPILMLSDFMHLDSTLASRITQFNSFLQGEVTINGATLNAFRDYDNRISVNNQSEYAAATQAGYSDYNGDAYIDELDLFMQHYDTDGDHRVHRSEFTKPDGTLVDHELFNAINTIGAPMYEGDVIREGYNDDYIDVLDGYAKLRGTITMATSESGWTNNLASQGKTINDMIQGTVAVDDPTDVPVKFGADSGDIIDLTPANFEDCVDGFRARSGTAAGSPTKTASVIANATLTAGDANGGTVDERTPYGSTSYQATYRRPVFRNMTFRNVTIPKGLNALFENCTFEGVTFVDGERNITKSNGSVTYSSSDGMSWAQRPMSGQPSFNKNTPLTSQSTQGSSKGNNIRFNNCNFNGPIAGAYATAYTHFANSWEFTGATRFDNQVDQTATVVAPQTNIEMGSFTNPGEAPSTLVGVVVAGNIDIRGTSTVDGSIIVTGDGAGNTTLAYFGASDSDTNPSALPEGGFGRLNIRYNPYRALPDGINIAIDILPEPDTYREELP